MGNNYDLEPFTNNSCWYGVLEGFKGYFKSIVKESMEEVIAEKMYTSNLEDKRLSTEELCERWNISKNTLHNWEQNGVISPLPIGGRKKLYSLADIHNAEACGLVKNYY